MLATACTLRGFEGHIRSQCYTRQSRFHNSPEPQKPQPAKSINSVVVVDFRDEAYASIANLLEQHGLIIYRAENATELAGKLVSKSPELVLLNGSQPDENAWLTSAKLRIIDASRSVWIYVPEPPSAIDEWLSMASTDDVIVYGGVLDRLLDLLRSRLAPKSTPSNSVTKDGKRRRVA